MNLSSTVALEEILSRDLLSKSLFSSQKQRVKSSAFLPPPDLHRSVFRVSGLSESDIWEIGEQEVVLRKQSQPKTLHGRADILARDIQEVGLRIEPDNIPPRHANIVGWSQKKSARKLIALELAERDTLQLRKF